MKDPAPVILGPNKIILLDLLQDQYGLEVEYAGPKKHPINT
jgi:hypothetical protein